MNNTTNRQLRNLRVEVEARLYQRELRRNPLEAPNMDVIAQKADDVELRGERDARFYRELERSQAGLQKQIENFRREFGGNSVVAE